ncbi:uncharacterized protein Z518_06213 [Rhinocladiella mackenziei CBS 650.93]|uniref:Rhinocladiella mackenziei CBS 650.93 unplaced genomic scaffold supercont1.4, whole genome shotgun sequence n=1 Tax=Rhinocladiella mackenziei CBS 650.93 TaxID=1442369 RepID=A0A0D2IQ74_9EURO|nr:uncharacterized protein Z518_06213 [Rhinocladiella mackenziei CBS 650.93]KIX05341.1 hypothetical protein Z518_06213 [Rhinocladiella mackenziei CBS 650.93]
MNGMDDNEDETGLFDDDDFDNLSESALQELEQNAILSTQRAQQQARAITNHFQPAPQSPVTLPPNRLLAQAPFNGRHHLLNPVIRKPVNEFQPGDDSFELVGDEGVPTPVEEIEAFPLRRMQLSEAQGEQFRPQRYGQAYNGVGLKQNSQSHRRPFPASLGDGWFPGVPSRSDEMLRDGLSLENMNALQGDDREAFRDHRIENLIRERDELTRELRETKDTVMMQKGEISIIRANFEKETKVFNRQVGVLKKSMEEEAARHTAALNAMKEKNNNLVTRYHFLQQEHNQELQETKSLRQRLKDRPQADKDASPVGTPKRGMARSLRDGFDDDDIMVMSPSKSARRPKPTPPTAVNKRKRKADVPSPVKPLVLRSSNTHPPDRPPSPPPPAQTDGPMVPVIRKDKQAERSLSFLQSILEYQVKQTKEPLVEALVGFSFPTNPSKKFSAILLDGVAHLKGDRLAGDLLQIFISLWSRSMKEQYYKPIALLIEIVSHIIELEMLVLDSGTISSLTPVLQTCVAINAEKRFEHSPVNHSTFGKFRQTPQSVLKKEVNGTACMELMLTVAYIVSDDPDLLTLFWRLMDPEFVLMMLNAWQPISDITLMLQLLATSIFSSTFGCVCVDAQQNTIENYIINRLCHLLWETPKVDEGLCPNTTKELCQLRVEVMDLLLKVAITSTPHPHDGPTHHGSKLIAHHTGAIARVVRSLHDEVSAMYNLLSSHALHAELVNKGIRLLYHVLKLHGSEINLQEKLSVINGGVHKHRVVLTRLAFSEGFYIDRLITDDTVAMATSMLEESVTPDEADELIEAFPGFKGRGASAAAPTAVSFDGGLR